MATPPPERSTSIMRHARCGRRAHTPSRRPPLPPRKDAAEAERDRLRVRVSMGREWVPRLSVSVAVSSPVTVAAGAIAPSAGDEQCPPRQFRPRAAGARRRVRWSEANAFHQAMTSQGQSFLWLCDGFYGMLTIGSTLMIKTKDGFYYDLTYSE